MFPKGIKYYLNVILRTGVTSNYGYIPWSENGPSPQGLLEASWLEDSCVATFLFAVWYK